MVSDTFFSRSPCIGQHLGFLFIESAQLLLGLCAGRVEPPRFTHEVIRRHDRCLQGLVHDFTWNTLGGIVFDDTPA